VIAWRCKCEWNPAWQQFCWRHDVVNAEGIPPNGTRIGVELLQKMSKIPSNITVFRAKFNTKTDEFALN
jgi:hypothetical protein